jgi:hypothetical protein
VTTHAISLRLINHGADCQSPIAIFRHDAAAAPDAPPIAWHVIDDLPAGATQELHYDLPTSHPPKVHLPPTIWIGVMSQVTQGEALDAAIAPHGHTEISLSGIASADIIMTGGGPSAASEPFQFALENVKYPL